MSVRALDITGLDPESVLLEREGELATLSAWFDEMQRESRGRLAFVGSEAGGGKTALLRRFCDDHRGLARILSGACDALFTPRPLGPLLDVAQLAGGELEAVVQSGAMPHDVTAVLVRELHKHAPTIVVIEDLHWADEATLDVLRLLCRRIESVPALVLASYRDDELEYTHPLRLVLGELATARATGRLRLAPLSEAAVVRMAEPYAIDAAELYRRTSGNPFFVTEVLAAGEAAIPATVRDAVLARVARLDSASRNVLEAVAVVPPQAELWLLELLAPDAVGHVEDCIASGTLRPDGLGVAFRHELARIAVEQSLPADRRVALHRRALAALADPPRGEPDLARVAHHAEAAGDVEAVRRFAPEAAERAASLGAHREAAAQYALALRFADGIPTERLGELLERRSYECYLIGQFGDALAAQEGALECHRLVGDRRREGDALRSQSRLLRYVGRIDDAMAAGQEAVAVLEALPPGRELARAYCQLSHLFVWAEDAERALLWAERALELAQRLDDAESLSYALLNIGTMEILAGKPQGRETLRRSLEIARSAGLEELVGRAYVNLVWWAPRDRSYASSDSDLDAGLEHCSERGLDLWRLYLLAYRARSEVDRGHWDDAVESAALVLRDARAAPIPRIWALSVLGLVRARRGDPDVWAPLDAAWSLAEPTAELQQIEPIAVARAEAAWLEGRDDAVAGLTESALALATRRGSSWVVGALACWRWRAGLREHALPDLAAPYAAELGGQWALAAELWSELDCPYDAALAGAAADDEDALRSALDDLQRLGARPAAVMVARRLRERGARGLPRGPRPTTRENPANLTPREVEVIALVSKGLRNGEIAEHLFLSERTVGHHVSAILRKLDVQTRGQASAEAARLGLVARDR